MILESESITGSEKSSTTGAKANLDLPVARLQCSEIAFVDFSETRPRF